MQSSILDEIFAKRGLPSVGGFSYHHMNPNDVKHIAISFYDIDPLTSRTEHFYNARTNVLSRRKLLSKNYAVWEPISLV